MEWRACSQRTTWGAASAADVWRCAAWESEHGLRGLLSRRGARIPQLSRVERNRRVNLKSTANATISLTQWFLVHESDTVSSMRSVVGSLLIVLICSFAHIHVVCACSRKKACQCDRREGIASGPLSNQYTAGRGLTIKR